MEYALFLSIILYVCSCFYLFFGIYAIITNRKSRTNKMFLYLTISMMVWAFTYSIANSASTAEKSAFWKATSVFGSGVFFSLFLQFILVLTKTQSHSQNKRLIIALIYLPALINIILFAPFGLLVKETYQMEPSKYGWINMAPMNWGRIWLVLYYLIYATICTLILIRWWKKLEPHTIMRRQATYFLISMIISFCIGVLIDILPDLFGIGLFPKITIIFLIGPILFLFLSLKKFGLLLERSKTVVLFPKSDYDLNKDRLRLFQSTAVIFMVGSAVSFLIGYFGINEPMKTQLFLALIIFSIGVFLIFLPRITKNHSTQNTIFLILCCIGMFFLMLLKANMATITVWSAYIIFLMATVILESRFHALFYILFCIVLQIFFWIDMPIANVIIDENEYLTRIFIILISYYSVKYLTNEYTSKLRGYQGFAKEQETLERISSNFISVNNENAQEKINEMFKMSSEVLDFDQGYLVEFSEDFEKGSIINAHTKEGTIEAFPFSPGMQFKTIAFPEAKTLLTEKQSIGCTDITSIPIDEGNEERNFFILRGMLSYYALPVILDDKVIGMLVVEDRRKANLRLKESHLNFLGVIANILADTKKKILYEEKIYNFAYFDETTKLANKNMLKKNLEQFLHNRKEQEKLVVFDVELDNLRMINDSFGHIIGEQIVKKSALILKNLMKEGCVLSRIAEGKFIIIMPIAETVEQINACINQIVDAFSEPISPRGKEESLFVTPIIGVAVYPDDGSDADTLLQNADLAGYMAKTADNKIAFYSQQLKSRIAENTLLTNRLFQAMKNEEFSLEFQPQISSKTEKTVGVEALLRWNYSDKKRIPPDVFIPILEQTGLIHDVGLWVLEQALQEHNRLIAKGFPPLRFSINLSIVQLRKDDFVREIIKLIEESKVEPKYIELEITESFLSQNFADTIEKLTKLKELGIGIAIDDFGKGYSSLHRLELVPFDRIKIDKSIVDDIILKKKKIVIVKTIVSLAKALMASITAEGVETKEQLDFLKNMDCDEIQGYYYSKPLPKEALEAFLKKE